MINKPEILKAWQRVLENTLKLYLVKKYPKEMDVYIRFRQSTGSHCALCRGSARLIFKQEAVNNKHFLKDFIDNKWDSNEYI